MNKKLLVILAASLLLLSATACKKNNEEPDEPAGTRDPNESYIVVPGTDADGNPVTYLEPVTKEPVTEAFDPSETDPTFTDVSKKIVVFANAATVRSATVVADNNVVGWPTENTVLDVTGESENWYRITYNEQTCYIAKAVAGGDPATLEAFTAIEGGEEVIVTASAVNVRSYPTSLSEYTKRGTLAKDTVVTRVAVSENWSRILYEVKSETETDADGNPKVEIKQYYVSNDYITPVNAETGAETTAAAE